MWLCAVATAVVLVVCAACAQEVPRPANQPEQALRACDPSGDPRSFIRLVADNDERNDKKARDYTYVQRIERRDLDGHGTVKKTETTTAEVMVIYGETVIRRIEKDGKPLSPSEQKKEDEKIEKLIRERENETPEQKEKRVAKYDKQRAEDRRFVEEVADAFQFTRRADEEVGGRAAFVFDAEPLAGFQPRHKQAKILPKFRFRAWIDQSDCQLAKLDAEAIDTISWGGIIARIRKGSRIVIEQTRVNDEVWLAKSLAVKLGARVLLVKGMNMEIEGSFRDYRKFRTDARVLGVVGGDAEPQK